MRSNSFYGPLDPAPDAGWEDAPARKGFFTDTSVCIGCKACEVACKEWNAVPEDGLLMLGSSYDNSGSLGASTWRHVKFIEQPKPLGHQDPGMAGTAAGPPMTDVLNRTADSALLGDRTALGTTTEPLEVRAPVDLGMPGTALPGAADGAQRTDFRWLMESDVCKHCTHAACLDVCPTGALFRTEFGTVVVQDDICNGCGYCVPACPFGVIDRRVGEKGVTKNEGIAQKCTLCYDRIGDGLEPACAKACPTKSIQYGDVEELRERAQARVDRLHEQGVHDARLYGNDTSDGIGGLGAFFLLLDEPEVYGLPPDPVVTTRDLPEMWRKAGLAALTMLAGAVAVFGSRG
ncbi:MAG: Formate dehydrogenase O beta subunit [uncultured Frankineae bacterium]|uniref:Formate dehydrogenase O beta subunit n=1 Tax=uncultured Frankineae bacterium TaxID=437475 RepID=A0A6J4MHU0_9ACTN|nr:MAG: Formate dehydrogenase O beta subunit [uncultured Frankineae bacterium]